jgi:hypothetical protein
LPSVLLLLPFLQDKLPQAVVDNVRAEISNARDALATDDKERITAAANKLKDALMEIGKNMYSGGGSGSGGDAPGSGDSGSGTYDADIKDEKKP